MALGNILISFEDNGNMRVDYSGKEKTAFGISNVNIVRALMSLEGMMVAQTDLSIAEVREILDDERAIAEVQTQADGIAEDVKEAEVVE